MFRKSDDDDGDDDGAGGGGDDEGSKKWLKEVESCECSCSSPTTKGIIHMYIAEETGAITDDDRVFTFCSASTARIGQVYCVVRYRNCHLSLP